MNVKLGGGNTAISKSLDIIAMTPTLVMGTDIHHPRVGNPNSPSIAAMVGSYDLQATRYFTIVMSQDHRKETVTGMDEAVKMLCKNFYLKTGKRKPKQIIIYRDGVGEGHFENILAHEVRAIKAGCRKLDKTYSPRVTFIIVQKRNHIRFFPERRNRASDRNGNMLPGTVIDTDIVHPHDFDFFMCSHAGLKGTSRPTHYHVLYDENKFKADKLQQLTYNLCHLYSRCTKTVSIPAPAYYAHLAAYRARLYTDMDLSDGLSEDDPGAVPVMPRVHDGLRERLYYA